MFVCLSTLCCKKAKNGSPSTEYLRFPLPLPTAGPSTTASSCARLAVRRARGAPVRLFLFVLAGAAMGTIDGFLFIDLQGLGGSTLVDGLALTVTCLSEAVVFWHAGAIQRALGVDGCIHVVLACYTLRLLYYACARRV